MKQLKYDKDGFILPQKINYDVKHEEESEEAIREVELEKELLKGLTILAPGDRNIRSLTIFCNPNYKRGSDQDISKIILSILEKMIDQRIIIKETSPKGRSIFFNLSNQKT